MVSWDVQTTVFQLTIEGIEVDIWGRGRVEWEVRINRVSATLCMNVYGLTCNDAGHAIGSSGRAGDRAGDGAAGARDHGLVVSLGTVVAMCAWDDDDED